MDEAQQVPNQNPITPSQFTTYPMAQPVTASKTPWVFISLTIILVGVASYFGYQNYQLKQQLSNQQSTSKPSEATEINPSPSLAPVQSPTKSDITWLKYRDDEYGVEVNYPEPTSDYYKRTMPVKQYLDNDLTQGYRLTLSMAGKNFDDFFLMIVRKKQPNFSFSSAWKATIVEGHMSDPKLNESTIEVGGREALLVDSLNTAYSEGKTLQVYQWIYVPLNDDYYIEIQKGKSPLTDQMIESITFL